MASEAGQSTSERNSIEQIRNWRPDPTLEPSNPLLVRYDKRVFGCEAFGIPIVDIVYDDLAYVVQTVSAERAKPSIPKDLEKVLSAPYRVATQTPSHDKVNMCALNSISGRFEAGTSTVILSAPGAGSTLFLRLLSGRSHLQTGHGLYFNGMTPGEVHNAGISLQRLVGFIPETDMHEPLLTVSETFQFVSNVAVNHKLVNETAKHPCTCGERYDMFLRGENPTSENTNATSTNLSAERNPNSIPLAEQEPSPFTHSRSNTAISTGEPTGEKVSAPNARIERTLSSKTSATTATGCHCAPWTAEYIIAALGLTEAKDTIVGNNLIRGVSGGQKKRVSIGEAILAGARIICADSITSGLDSATAYNVVNFLIDWARKTGGIFICVLQQPSPDILFSFDNSLLLADGLELYHGPTKAMEDYFMSLGFVVPDYMDLADYISELVAYPERAVEITTEYRKEVGCMYIGDKCRNEALNERALKSCDREKLRCLPQPKLTNVRDLAIFWRNSAAFKSMMGGTQALFARGKEKGLRKLLRAPCIDEINYNDLSSPGMTETLAYPVPDVNKGVWTAKGLHDGISLQTDYAKTQFGLHEPTTFWSQLKALIKRQGIMIARNKNLLFARLVNSLIMGLVLGTLFLTPGMEQYQVKFGLALFACIFIGFTNNAEVPAAIQSRSVVYRHTQASYYSTLLYIICLVVTSIPITIITNLVFSSLVYWMTGWTASVVRWLVFMLTLFAVDLVMAGYLRTMAFIFPTLELSSSAGTFIIAVWMLCAGFYVIRTEMPVWLQWTPYISPFFWAVTSIVNNEFHAGRYQVPAAVGSDQTLGEVYISTYDYPYSKMAQWGGIIFLFGIWALITLIIAPLALKVFVYDVFPGTSRSYTGSAAALDMYLHGHDLPVAEEAARTNESLQELSAIPYDINSIPAGTTVEVELNNVAPGTEVTPAGVIIEPQEPAGEVPSPSLSPTLTATGATAQATVPTTEEATTVSDHGSGSPSPSETDSLVRSPDEVPVTGVRKKPLMPFHPVTLAFQDLTYTIPIKGKGRRTLLDHVEGVMKPGTMTALMGATGAGKTTLLNVLAQRATIGEATGTIELNGQRVDTRIMNLVTAFAEQEDIHYPTPTVEEALWFSIRLRTKGLDKEAKHNVVSTILRVLELESVRDRIVHSLSRGEMKRLTIGVELVSNPSIIFLDEPTTGLEARAASVVVKVLRRVASTGRTVICTIHQPSAEIFFSFDQLLLLAPGGRQVYFGPTGHHSQKIVEFFEAVPGVEKLPTSTNPSTWMLRVLSETPYATPKRVGPESEALEAEPIEKVDRIESQEPLAAQNSGVEEEQAPASHAARTSAHSISTTGSDYTGRGSGRRLRHRLSEPLEYPSKPCSQRSLSSRDEIATGHLMGGTASGMGIWNPKRDENTIVSPFNPADEVAPEIEGSPKESIIEGAAAAPSGDVTTAPARTETEEEGALKELSFQRFAAYYAASELHRFNQMDVGRFIQGKPLGNNGEPIVVPTIEALLRRKQESTVAPSVEAVEGTNVSETAEQPNVNLLAAPTTTSTQSAVPAPRSEPSADVEAPFSPISNAHPSPEIASTSPQQSEEGLLKIKKDRETSSPALQEEEGDVVVLAPIMIKKSASQPFGVQWWEVYERCNVDYWRNSEVFISRLFISIFLGVLFGILFLNNDPLTFAGTTSLLGFILGGVAFSSIIFMSSSINLQFERRPVYYRERTAHYYHAPAYSLSIFLVELPYVASISLIFCSIAYWIAGLRTSAASFFFFYLNAFTISLFFMALGVLYSSMMPSLPIAQILTGISISFCFLFAGLFRRIPDIPKGWKGLGYAVPTTHMMRAIATDQFFCLNEAGGRTALSVGEKVLTPQCPIIDVIVPGTTQVQQLDRFQYVQEFLGFRTDHRFPWGEVGWAALASLVVFVIAISSLQFFKYQTK